MHASSKILQIQMKKSRKSALCKLFEFAENWAIVSHMPIDFAQMEFVQRSKGHSAVAGSAYQCGSKFYEQRTGLNHDYTKRKDVMYSEVLLPEGASEVFSNPEFLWNEAENFEVKKKCSNSASFGFGATGR